MGLSMITENGLISWRCHNGRCPAQTAHILDEAVRWISPDMVSLPACPICGEQRSLKVRYSEEEQRVENMQQYGMVPTQMHVPHALTGEQIPVMIPALQAIGKNPIVARHQEMCRQLDAAGKIYKSE